MPHPQALPHDPITQVVDGIYAVRGAFDMGPGMRISRTMTIIQQPDGLVILNAVRLSAAGETELAKLGKVAHLVKLSDSHNRDEPYYADHFQPRVWTTPKARLKGITATDQLGPDSPIAGAMVIAYPGASGWDERGLWVPHGGGTLITTDAVQNHCDTSGTSFLGRMMMSLMGFKGGVIVAPMWRKYQKVQGAAVTAAFASALERPFENLVTGHGPAVKGGASKQVRDAVAKAAA